MKNHIGVSKFLEDFTHECQSLEYMSRPSFFAPKSLEEFGVAHHLAVECNESQFRQHDTMTFHRLARIGVAHILFSKLVFDFPKTSIGHICPFSKEITEICRLRAAPVASRHARNIGICLRLRNTTGLLSLDSFSAIPIENGSSASDRPTTPDHWFRLRAPMTHRMKETPTHDRATG